MFWDLGLFLFGLLVGAALVAVGVVAAMHAIYGGWRNPGG